MKIKLCLATSALLFLAVILAAAPAPAQESGHRHGTASSEAAPKQKAAQKDAFDEAPAVEVPAEKQKLIGLKTAEVTRRPLSHTIRTVGRVETDERKLSVVNTKVEGWIDRLHVNYTGEYVMKGAPLAEIFNPELIATQQELLNAHAWKKQAETAAGGALAKMRADDAKALFEAAKQRLRLWDIRDDQIEKIISEGSPSRTLTVFSPVSGHVLEKMAIEGMKVMAGEKLFTLADLSSVWVTADIYEFELTHIKVGQQATISLSYFPGEEFRSRIEYVYPTLSGDTRTSRVRFSVPNPKGELKPQMFTNVELKISLGSRVTIPEDAVIDSGTRKIVYVERESGIFEPREVLTGVKSDGFYEIIKGATAGEKVATGATFLIDSEAKLTGIKPLPVTNTD